MLINRGFRIDGSRPGRTASTGTIADADVGVSAVTHTPARRLAAAAIRYFYTAANGRPIRRSLIIQAKYGTFTGSIPHVHFSSERLSP
jgi:hypothetical protein